MNTRHSKFVRIGTRPDTQRIPDATPKRRLFIAGDVFRGEVSCEINISGSELIQRVLNQLDGLSRAIERFTEVDGER